MGEEEIIEILKDFTENEYTAYCYDWQGFAYTIILPAIQGLLDLYNKEKEKNKELLEEYHKRVSTIIKYEQTIKEAVDEFENVLEK